MNRTKWIKSVLTGAVVWAASNFIVSQAGATIINFEDVVGSPFLSSGNSGVSQGYRFTEAGSFAEVLGNSGQGATDFSGNGTKRLIAFNTSTITIEALSNSQFNLVNFDGGESWIQQPHIWARQIRVVGFIAGGGSTTQIFDLDLIKSPLAGMQTFMLNGTFHNLQKVALSGIGGNPEFSLDNLSVVTVPEPASIVLLLLGMIGIAASRRKSAR